MTMMALRFAMAILSLIGIGAAFGATLWIGKDLTTTQVAFASPLAMALIFIAKSATSFIFDGVPTDDSNPPIPQPVQKGPPL